RVACGGASSTRTLKGMPGQVRAALLRRQLTTCSGRRSATTCPKQEDREEIALVSVTLMRAFYLGLLQWERSTTRSRNVMRAAGDTIPPSRLLHRRSLRCRSFRTLVLPGSADNRSPLARS